MILTCAIHDNRDPAGACACSDLVVALRLSAADDVTLRALRRAIERVGLEESVAYLALIDRILTAQGSGQGMRPSPLDQRRLRDGAAALAAARRLPSPRPRTRAEVESLLEQVSDGIRAMQSLDDLGEAGNAQAVQDLDELGRWQRALAAQIKGLP